MTKVEIFQQKKAEIRAVIDRKFGVNFLKKTRERDIVYPKHLYVYCLYIFTDARLKKIANDVGYKNHSSVITSVKAVRALCKFNEEIKKEVITIEAVLE